MKVIKKDGRLQEMDLLKIARSIINASKDINRMLGDKEALLVAEDVRNKLEILRKDGSNTSSYEIRAILTEMLNISGYKDLAESYNRNWV